MSKKIAKTDIEKPSLLHPLDRAVKQDRRVGITTKVTDLGQLKLGVKDYEIKCRNKKTKTIGKFKHY